MQKQIFSPFPLSVHSVCSWTGARQPAVGRGCSIDSVCQLLLGPLKREDCVSQEQGWRQVFPAFCPPACPNCVDRHRSPLRLLCGSCDTNQKFMIPGTPPGEPCFFGMRIEKLGYGGTVRGRSVPHLTDTSLFLPFSVFQVYVSYDYGKSFSKISEKLNFGVGNSTEAVISQFYHSPADNKRVRRPWLQGTAFWEDGRTEGGWGMEPFAIFAAHMGHQLYLFYLIWELVTEHSSQGESLHSESGYSVRQDFWTNKSRFNHRKSANQ